MKTYEIIDDIRSNIQILLKEEYKRGYADGQAEIGATEKHWGKKQYTLDNLQQQSDFSYMRGLEDAWECAKKIISPHGEGYNATDFEVFGVDNVFDLPASEAVQKLREYEGKQTENVDCGSMECHNCTNHNYCDYKCDYESDEIKVGDEVYIDGDRKAVVSRVLDNDLYNIVFYNGDTNCVDSDFIAKTGRHFPQISEVLKQMQEDKTE